MLKKVKSLRKRGTYVVPTKYYACEQKTITHNPAVFSYDLNVLSMMCKSCLSTDSTSFVAVHAQSEWCGHCIYKMCFCLLFPSSFIFLGFQFVILRPDVQIAKTHDPCSIWYDFVSVIQRRLTNVWVHKQTNILPIAIFCISPLIVILMCLPQRCIDC